MNRRSFLKRLGAGGSLACASVGLPSIVSFSDSVEIRLFLGDTLGEEVESKETYLVGGESFSSRKKFMSWLAHSVEKVYSATFSELDISVTVGAVDVVERNEGDINRWEETVSWDQRVRASSELETGDSNLILRSLTGRDSGNAVRGGFGFSGLLPSCCTSVGNAGSAWVDISAVWPKQVVRLVAHEVGHSLGLLHVHGCNFVRETDSGMFKERSVMLPGFLDSTLPVNVFGESVELSWSFRNQFNPDLDKSYLRV